MKKRKREKKMFASNENLKKKLARWYDIVEDGGTIGTATDFH